MCDRELFIRSLNFREAIHFKLLEISYNSTDKEFIENVLMFFRHDESTYNCQSDCDVVAELKSNVNYLETKRYENVEEKDEAPGFELITLIVAFGVIFIILKRRK